jgi:hypothetical protein
MTAEAFLQCLNREGQQTCTLEDGLKLAEIVASWTEAERRKLSKAAVERHRSPRDFKIYSSSAYHLLDLAVLAVGPFSAVKRCEPFYQFEAAAIKVLCDRRPDWVDQWIAVQLGKKHLAISWWMFHELLHAGVCSKPTSEDYIRFLGTAMTGETDPWRPGPRIHIHRSEYLRQNPEFIDDVWRIFAVETPVFFALEAGPVNSAANNDNTYEDWRTTLIRLSQVGLLDRQRLLTATLRALGSDFSANALTGFARFFESLAPTLEERSAAQSELNELLSNRASHVVKFALEHLGELHKAGLLDGSAFLTAAPAVFALKPKGQPLTVLSLAGKVAKDHPELIPEAANLAIEALAHDASDVQAAAMKLLEGWQARLHRDHASELRSKLPGLAASIRPRAEALIAALGGGDAEPNDLPSPAPPSSLAEFQTRAAMIPSHWRSLAGVDDALSTAETDTCFPGIWFNINHVPVLTSCEPIVPIETVDQLLDVVAHALEELDSGDELERILDGISRLCDQRPADFDHRAQPLVQRLLADRHYSSRGILNFHAYPKLQQLLLRWLGAPGQGRFQQIEDPRGLTKFIERRLREIEARMAVKRPAPLLAAPTHQHGWLDPRVLVQRLQPYAMPAPPLADLIQALLRSAPDHRQAALAAARDLPDDWGAAVRYALGGPLPTDVMASEERFSLWFAAGRSRQAFGQLTELELAGGPPRVPVLAQPTFAWEPIAADTSQRWSTGMTAVKLRVDPVLPRAEASALRPTLAICEENLNRWEDFGPEWCKAWLITLWPANLDAVLAEGVRQLRERINSPASAFDPHYIYLQPLLRPDLPWNEISYLALWLALVSKDAGSRGMAIDVLIAGIEDGRAELKCDVPLKLAGGEWFKLNRLAEAGREIARVSPRHAWWWAEFLQRFLFQLPAWPTEVHYLLALLLELLSELQLGVGDLWRENLQARQVSGKSAKLLKSILALQTTANSTARQQAHRVAIEATLSRAERWAAGTGE